MISGLERSPGEGKGYPLQHSGLQLCLFYKVGITIKGGFPGGSDGEESACNVGDLGLIPGLGRPPGGGHGNPLQYSGLENSIDCVSHGVTKSQTQLSDFHFHFS